MQNEKTLQQMIREYEHNMPPEIMDLINSFDWRKEVRMIVNQNQLMIDIGADLEESVYLMILGIVDIEEVFERLIDVHELPQDKVEKVLQEVEQQIFEPMHKKLSQLEKTDQGSIKKSANTQDLDDVHVSRDEILNEIEKDEPAIIIKKPVDSLPPPPPPPVVSTSSPLSSSASNDMVFTEPYSDGAREPFSLIKHLDLAQDVVEQPVNVVPQQPPVAVANPISTPLTPPIAPAPTTPPSSFVPPNKTQSFDPYREPIE